MNLDLESSVSFVTIEELKNEFGGDPRSCRFFEKLQKVAHLGEAELLLPVIEGYRLYSKNLLELVLQKGGYSCITDWNALASYLKIPQYGAHMEQHYVKYLLFFERWVIDSHTRLKQTFIWNKLIKSNELKKDQVIGNSKYRIEKIVGHGSFGQVAIAQQLNLEGKFIVAIKCESVTRRNFIESTFEGLKNSCIRY